jgi:ABC-type multidrug transport system ATPase subunit
VILADEPVASLDPASAVSVLSLLRDIAHEGGITVLCSLHQVDFVPGFADRVLGLRAGQLVTDSAIENFETLRDHEMIYARPSTSGAEPLLVLTRQPSRAGMSSATLATKSGNRGEQPAPVQPAPVPAVIDAVGGLAMREPLNEPAAAPFEILDGLHRVRNFLVCARPVD